MANNNIFRKFSLNYEYEEHKIEIDNEYYNERYLYEKTIEITNCSSVLLVTNNITNKKTIIKILSLKNDDKNHNKKSRAENEYILMKSLKHENIVECFDMFYDNKRFFIEMEYAILGDLFNYRTIYEDNQIDHSLVKKIMKQLCNGLIYIHSNGIIHRDIKLENIFVYNFNSYKIGDFGLSIKSEITKGKVGTPQCMSPEMVMNYFYSFSTDVWSLGVLLYELIYVKSPFYEERIEMIYKSISYKKYEFTKKDKIYDEINDLLINMLQYTDYRISLKDVLENPWIKAI